MPAPRDILKEGTVRAPGKYPSSRGHTVQAPGTLSAVTNPYTAREPTGRCNDEISDCRLGCSAHLYVVRGRLIPRPFGARILALLGVRRFSDAFGFGVRYLYSLIDADGVVFQLVLIG